MEFVTERGPAGEAAIAAVEVLTGARFPDSYRNFLQRHDGGRPQDTEFDVSDGHISTISDLLTTAPDDPNYMLRVLDYHDENYPSGIWPIADVGNGDQIVMSVSGDRRGQILYFFHDRDAPRPIPEATNLTKLADSFDEFTAMQRPVAH